MIIGSRKKNLLPSSLTNWDRRPVGLHSFCNPNCSFFINFCIHLSLHLCLFVFIRKRCHDASDFLYSTEGTFCLWVVRETEKQGGSVSFLFTSSIIGFQKLQCLRRSVREERTDR
ncbi:hypothetical protein NE237_016416 [Protea cynaroides]|uniref:Uncharacterized protein n=1 Tax=Protea cynaroides TaxID=273540 RepID=A0A9Q0HDT7_9MAGN|nr:hypothetical protein NE237_016416 [Protea cynaroides]